eukprot:3884216-Alexandrium_andersonii.AAC.1
MIDAYRLRWKVESLCYLSSSPAAETPEQLMCVVGEASYAIPRVVSMEVLGTLLSHDGATMPAVEH